MSAHQAASNSGVGPRPTEAGLANVQRPDDSQLIKTPVDAIKAAHAKAQEAFRRGQTRSYEWRMDQLTGLRKMCEESADELLAAVEADLSKPKMENFLCEVSQPVSEIDYALKNLKSWMEPQSVKTGILQQPGRSVVIREPKGVVLVITPWNFPVNLALMSIVPVLAAGNACVLKPSEISRNGEKVLRDLLPRYLDPEAVQVITGGVEETTAALRLPWDHIFYTGGGSVARVVLKEAAQHLTPCTLELGGKSPTVVLPGAKVSQAAKRILGTKLMNCGQICISPDYVLVHEDVERELVSELQKTLFEWLGDDASKCPDYGRIINTAHFNRLKSLIDSTDGEVLPYQGQFDEASKFIPPVLVKNPSKHDRLLSEEIFGPVFPILTFKSVDEIVDHINEGEKPLAMYIFSTEAQADDVIRRTSSGGVCVNDTMFHMTNPELPFGGIGGSGMGRYHGKWGFDEFSHLRSVMYRATWLDLPQRYRPFTESKQNMLERLIVGPIIPEGIKKAIVAAGGAAAAGAVALVARSRL